MKCWGWGRGAEPDGKDSELKVFRTSLWEGGW